MPENYLTKKEARKIGWKDKKGNLAEVANGKIIGGEVYQNKYGRLPQANGRICMKQILITHPDIAEQNVFCILTMD